MKTALDPTDDYVIFTPQEATNHLFDVLDYFFSDSTNVTRYPLPKKHYDTALQKRRFYNANRLFQIISGTNLVNKKHVLTHKTPAGTQYLLHKHYHQRIQRHFRTVQRTVQQIQSPNPTNPTPKITNAERTRYDILQSDSDDNTTTTSNNDGKIEILTQQQNQASVSSNAVPTSVSATKPDDNSIASDITKHADDLERSMDDAHASLQREQLNSKDNDIQTTIQDTIVSLTNTFNAKFTALEDMTKQKQQEFDNMMSRLQTKETELNESITKYKETNDQLNTLVFTASELNTELKNNIQRIKTTYIVLKKKVDTVNTLEQKVHNITENLQSNLQASTDKCNQLIAATDQKCQDLLTKTNLTTVGHNTDINDLDLPTIRREHSKVNKKMTKIKANIKILAQQHEDEYDMFSNRIQVLETDIIELKNKDHIHTSKKKLTFSSSSDSESDTNIQMSPVYSKQNLKSVQSSTNETPSKYNGPNTEYLRKNINITCNDVDQILDFYIKLRLVVRKGGINLIAIEDIAKQSSLADTTNQQHHNDTILQSNALYTILSNENIIPSDFKMAQNCILGYANTMDGFEALKAMLKMVHPTLNKKRPTNVPPLLSQHSEIHAYEQSLRNYYLLHKLYNGMDYLPIEKSKQFLQGIDDDQYNNAVMRIRHQLDTHETLGTDLHEDYKIENLASTIINITTEYENTTTVIRTLRNNDNESKSTQRHFNKKALPYNKKRSTTQAQKVQCHACKLFGHAVTKCNLLPKVLAIMKFSTMQKSQCENILRNHIANNTVEAKRNVVRVLQNMHIIPSDADIDDYMTDDLIVNTMNDNVFTSDDEDSDHDE